MVDNNCPVCGGSRKITVPLRRMAEVQVAAEDAWKLPAAIERTSREYPCPECSQQFVQYSRLATVSISREARAEYREMAAGHIRRNLAAAIGDYMLRHDLIAFSEEDGTEMHGFSCVRFIAKAGVVAPKKVAEFEDRVRERQFEVADQFAEAYAAEVSNWGSDYGVPNVQKAQALAWIREVLARVKAKVKHG